MEKEVFMQELRELSRRSRGLGEPGNYFAGRTGAGETAPDNILCFHRGSIGAGHRLDNVHHRFVLICCLDGEGTLFVDEHVVRMPVGTGVLIFPLQFHHYLIPEAAVSWLFVTFELAGIGWLESLRSRAVGFTCLDLEILTFLTDAWQRPGKSVDNGELRFALGFLLSRLVATTRHSAGPVAAKCLHPPPQAGRAASLMQKLNAYIHTHLEADLSVAALARQVGVSPSHLRLLVRSQIGLGLGHYVRRIRLNRAQSCLSGTDWPVSHVAQKCGFGSAQSFARTFRQMTGQAPLSFRNCKGRGRRCS